MAARQGSAAPSRARPGLASAAFRVGSARFGGSVARSKSKQKIKRHRRDVKRKHRLERRKLARSQESGR
jgi:hypothetical protein